MNHFESWVINLIWTKKLVLLYSDTSPFSIPCLDLQVNIRLLRRIWQGENTLAYCGRVSEEGYKFY